MVGWRGKEDGGGDETWSTSASFDAPCDSHLLINSAYD